MQTWIICRSGFIEPALPVFALSFLFMAVNLIITAYFYSTKQTGKANMIVVSRGIIVKALAIFLTPVVLGNHHVWLAVSIAEGITMVICLIYSKRDAR